LVAFAPDGSAHLYIGAALVLSVLGGILAIRTLKQPPQALGTVGVALNLLGVGLYGFGFLALFVNLGGA
jgi:hypothetical protein